jgi:proline iminopeptidase
MSLAPDAAPSLSVADPAFQLAFGRLVTHYWSPGYLLEEGSYCVTSNGSMGFLPC